MKWLVIFDYQREQSLCDPGNLNVIDGIIFIGMELGLKFEEIVEFPVTVFKMIGDSLGNIYEEKNRQQKKAMGK